MYIYIYTHSICRVYGAATPVKSFNACLVSRPMPFAHQGKSWQIPHVCSKLSHSAMVLMGSDGLGSVTGQGLHSCHEADLHKEY